MKTLFICSVTCVLFGTATAVFADTVDVSAPILPKVLTLYAQEGVTLPTAPTAELALVASASLIFETLLADCKSNPTYAGAYAGISLWNPVDAPLTPTQLTANYSLVAQCSYEQYTAKPYWIPKLVNDVDICGTQLGSDWRLPTEADLASFTDENFATMQNTLIGIADGTFWGGFYFTLHIYVRAADGSLVQGDLTPGVAQRITPFPASIDWTRHYESDLSLRCIRVSSGS